MKSANLLLKKDFDTRRQRNPKFSVRAYANFLGVDNSLLSKILTGKRDVSYQFISTIKQKLLINKEELEETLKDISNENLVNTFRLRKSKQKYQEISQAKFEVISDWRHYAFLDLFKLKDFRQDKKWAAEKLRTDESRVSQIIDNLSRLELLKTDSNGVWIDMTSGSCTHILEGKEMSLANKIYQQSVLDGAKAAIDEIDISLRDQSSMMMVTSTEKIIEAKILIKEFRRKLCEFLEDTDDPNCIYQVGIGIYPVTEVS